jgi:hypothetical protein
VIFWRLDMGTPWYFLEILRGLFLNNCCLIQDRKLNFVSNLK